MKKIVLYRSTFCPRCHIVAKHLSALQKHYGDFHIEEVDIVTNPLRTWHDGIRMIPALKMNNRTLSGLILSRNTINSFITEGNAQP